MNSAQKARMSQKSHERPPLTTDHVQIPHSSFVNCKVFQREYKGHF